MDESGISDVQSTSCQSTWTWKPIFPLTPM